MFGINVKTTHCKSVYGKNDFAEGSKILLNTDLKIILLEF